MNLSNYKHLIFDYDNTIARVPIDWRVARVNFRKFLTEKFPGIELERGIRVDEMERIAIEFFPEKKKEIFSFRNSLEKSFDGNHEPIYDVINLIRKCALGSLHIISNNLKSTVFSGLRQFKIMQFFDVIIGVDQAGFPKPCTAAWDILLKSREINQKSCLFIGDSQVTDEKFAQRVGISFLDVNDLAGPNNE